MSGTKTILGDNFESGGGNQTVVKDGATVIQAKEVHLGSRQPALPVIPRDLQPLDACFLGRDKELAELMEHLQPGKVAAVCGPGGMGKSALAAQAVNRLEKDRFPDGIVFHSFYGHPQTEQALQYIAEAFQVEVKAGLASTVRQILSGKKALLILDGTEEADDLKAVLDLRSTCGVLITSRKRDDAQGFRLDLTPLEDEPAVEVLREYSGLVGDDEAVQGICKILDGWPVGLRIAGRYLDTTGEKAADYLKWLNKKPFKELGSGKHQQENANLLLQRSVAQVNKDAKRMLGLAGTLAFAPIARQPLVIILNSDERRTRIALHELVNYGLLFPNDDRWQISHALIHTYARTKLRLRKGNLEQFAMSYAIFCQKQNKAGIKGYTCLNGERAHCLRLIEVCLKKGLWQRVQALVEAIDIYLERQGHWIEEVVALKMNLTAIQQSNDRKNEGVCLNNLGYIYDRRGEPEKALVYYNQCLFIHRELDDKNEESITLNNIAKIYQQQGKYNLALQQYEQCLRIQGTIRNQAGKSTTLNNIGMIYYAKNDYETALAYLNQCLPLTQKVCDKFRESATLNNIGLIYAAQNDPTKALNYHEQALMICHKISDRVGEVQSRWNIGLIYKELSDLAQAEEYISKVVEIAETIGLPELEQFRDGLAQVRAKRQGAEE